MEQEFLSLIFQEEKPYRGERRIGIYKGSKKIGGIEQVYSPYRGTTYYHAFANRPYTFTVPTANSVAQAKQNFVRALKEHGGNAPTSADIKYLPADPDAEFYPTPSWLAGKMLACLDRDAPIRSVLEPSAGKGDLLYALQKYNAAQRYGKDEDIFELTDVIEADQNLRGLLKGAGFRVIGDDFLQFHTHKHYDLILMNPPFSNGDAHLLRALDIQSGGGQVLCLLNAETLKNPYTNRRKALLQKLEEHHAHVEYVQGAFQKAARKSDVEVAIIHVNISAPAMRSNIISYLKRAESTAEIESGEASSIVSANWMENLINGYEFEAKAGIALLREYAAMRPYLMDGHTNYEKPLISLAVGERELGEGAPSGSINRYLEKLRYKYWNAFLSREEITSRMTSAMQKQYSEKISDLKHYDFNLYNLQQVFFDIRAQLSANIEDSILDLFETLSGKYAWIREENNKNIRYFNGWATNKAHKVGMKAILPINGFGSSYSWTKDKLDSYYISTPLSDLERAMNYLDRGETTDRKNLRNFIDYAVKCGDTVVETTYFKAKFYKKGTCHIQFRPEAQRIIDRLNIFAAQKKNWLPPCYGRKRYKDMTPEEAAVIDDFQGKDAYEKLMENPGLYLTDAASSDFLSLPT